jgi:hypothetical protein
MIFSGNPKGFLGSKHYYLFSFLRIGRKEGRKERRKEGRKKGKKERVGRLFCFTSSFSTHCCR